MGVEWVGVKARTREFRGGRAWCQLGAARVKGAKGERGRSWESFVVIDELQ